MTQRNIHDVIFDNNFNKTTSELLVVHGGDVLSMRQAEDLCAEAGVAWRRASLPANATEVTVSQLTETFLHNEATIERHILVGHTDKEEKDLPRPVSEKCTAKHQLVAYYATDKELMQRARREQSVTQSLGSFEPQEA